MCVKENSVKTERFLRDKRGAVVAMSLVILAGCVSSHTPAKRSINEERYSLLARDVFNETNTLRTDPEAYVAILKNITKRMSGKIYRPLNSEVGIITNEGVSAVNEAIKVLNKQKPLRKLTWSDELAKLARAHVDDTGTKGLVGHDSSSGRSFSDRVASVIVRGKFASGAENLSYGYSNGRDVVSQLFVDDGVPGRGHRTNLLNRQLTHTGVACGYHRQYGHMCTAIYASRE